MAEVTFPSSPFPRGMRWRMVKPAQVNVSEWTGARQVLDLGRGWWECEIELPPVLGADAETWRGFISAAAGQVNTFRVKPVAGGNQLVVAGGTPTCVGAVTGGTTAIPFDGAAANTTYPAGLWLSANDQLFRLTQSVTSSGTGTGTFNVQPPVRGTMPDNTIFEYDDPNMLAYLTEDVQEDNMLGDVLAITLMIREAF